MDTDQNLFSAFLVTVITQSALGQKLCLTTASYNNLFYTHYVHFIYCSATDDFKITS